MGPTRPTPNLLGTTIYLGMYFNFTRINGVDIWYKPGNDTGDKGTELFGNGIRWDIGQGWGTWGGTQGSVGHYTIWEANPSFHLNPSIEYYDAIPNNRGGYGVGHSVQLAYDTWHSLVRVIRFSNTNTGYVALYADGVLISEYDNIITAANNTPDIDIIGLGGTMCQPAYDCPPHHRRYDAFLLTDSWQDIVNGGYLGGSDTTPPAAPTALGVQ
ncbi:MAG: hypothetical protein IPJ68_00160 [Candidatus Moraniibacteriota bacterium]|nr:MAG: hypothetical protein IPJ68_00160 [Candidatus Moranbacteria bacterium]